MMQAYGKVLLATRTSQHNKRVWRRYVPSSKSLASRAAHGNKYWTATRLHSADENAVEHGRSPLLPSPKRAFHPLDLQQSRLRSKRYSCTSRLTSPTLSSTSSFPSYRTSNRRSSPPH